MFRLFVAMIALTFACGATAADPQDNASLFTLSNGSGTRVNLLVGNFQCKEPERRAVLSNDTGAWLGCWHADSDHNAIEIVWEDGTRLSVPLSAIKGVHPGTPDDDMPALPGGAVPHGPQIQG